MAPTNRFASASGEYHGLLGTVIQVTTLADDEVNAVTVETTAIGEVERLQSIFDVFDPSSQLRRWQRDEVELGPEIAEVLKRAEYWRQTSGGAFDPNMGAAMQLWEQAALSQRSPSVAELHISIDRRDPQTANLNGIAKGWIVDRAVDAARRVPGAVGVTLNAGGDIRHIGPLPVNVGIEDPHRPYDNVAPRQVIRLDEGAIASSGGGRRGWTINGEWHSHVLDPRSGYPAGHVVQATVMAATACDADAIATALTVLAADERPAFCNALDPMVGYLIIDVAGNSVSNAIWEQARLS